MSRHDASHDELLARISVGEVIAPTDLQELEACPRCAAVLAGLQHTRARLERWGRQQRDALEEALANIQPRDFELGNGLCSRFPPKRPPTRLWLVLAAVALLVLGGWFAGNWLLDAGHRPVAPTYLGADDVALHPDGPVARYDAFRWQWSRLPGETYALLIWNEGETKPVIEARRLQSEEYRPTAKELARLGPAIHWEVHLLGASGEFVRVIGSASASR